MWLCDWWVSSGYGVWGSCDGSWLLVINVEAPVGIFAVGDAVVSECWCGFLLSLGIGWSIFLMGLGIVYERA